MAAPPPVAAAPVKPWHAGVLVVKAPSGALVISGIDPKSTVWADPNIKVGDVLSSVDGRAPSSLGEALTLLKGARGSPVVVQTESGRASVPRDSNCSLGAAAVKAPTAPTAANLGPAVAGQAISEADLKTLGLPAGSRWGPSRTDAAASESYLSI